VSIVTDGWGGYGGIVGFGFGATWTNAEDATHVYRFFPGVTPAGGGSRKRLGDNPEWEYPIYEDEPVAARKLNRWIMRNVDNGPFVKVWMRWRAKSEGMDEKTRKAGLRRWMDRAEKQKHREGSPFLFVSGMVMLLGRYVAATKG
jgi:hypothetical protein